MASPSRDSKNSRMAGIDVIRVISLFAIVVGHAYTSEWADRYLQSWRLPIFFMLSGFFYSSRRTLSEDAIRRGALLLIPYLSWGCALVTVAVALFDFDFWELSKQFLLGGSYALRPLTTLWFLTALFAAALMYRLLFRFNNIVIWGVAIIGLSANVVFGSALAKVPWSLATATGALFFIHSGQCIATLQSRAPESTVRMASILVLALCLLTLTIFPGDFEPLRMKQGAFPPLAVILSVPICGSMISLGASIELPKRIARLANLAATPSLVVILLHPVLLIAFSGNIPYPLVPVSAFAVALGFGFLVIRTPFAKILCGVPRLREP